MNLGVFLFIFFLLFAIFLIYTFCVCMHRHIMDDEADWWSIFFFQKYYVPLMRGYLKYLCIWVGLQLWITTVVAGSIIWFIFAIAWTFLVGVLRRAITDMFSDILYTALDDYQPYLEKEMDVYPKIVMFRWLMLAMTFIIFYAWLAVAMAHGWVFFPKLITAATAITVLKIYKVCSRVYKWLRRNG